MDKTFSPTVQWMSDKYNEMNAQLFGGELGECDFGIFTSGRGSEGGVLGWFKIKGKQIRIDRGSRRMYQESFWNVQREYINKSNFVEICKPKIEINGNYRGTEIGFLATLVHEMCHYYTYMYGIAPKQGHGVEFRRIGSIVSGRSKGLFTIQRLATAEEMREFELSDEMKAKKERRIANKKASVTAVVVFTQNNEVQLSITSNQELINRIVNHSQKNGNEVITSNDPEVIDFLFRKGFRKNMRVWRYWPLQKAPWLNEFKSILGYNPIGNTYEEEIPNASKDAPKKMFVIKTSNGVFEHEANAELKRSLQERFPKMSDETIEKIINNPSNYRIMESNVNIKKIVESVINEFKRTKSNNDDSISITPDMNLGLYSPLEMTEGLTNNDKN